MTRLDFDPDLERLGEALRASTTIDLAREERAARAWRRTRPRLLAAATAAAAASATAVTLLLSSAASPPAAFAVTRHDGSVSVKINRRTSLADVNRRLAAMGIERIGKRAMAAGEDLSSIPSCSSIPPGWKGEWVKMAGSSSGPGYSISESVAPGTWVLIVCTAGVPGYTGSGSTGTTGSGNAGNTGAG